VGEFKLFAIALLLWGASNLAANTNGDGLDNYKGEIGKRVSALNTSVPDLNLKQRAEPLNIPAALQTLSDVTKLESALRGEENFPPHSLTTLTCSRALCYNEGDI
jgi:hypothetical protein